ncbi:MAG: glycosyl hydrolase, partial [Bacteroidota bacterium]
MQRIVLFFLCLAPVLLLGQMAEQPPATSAADRVASFEQHKKLEANSIVNGVKFRSVGPSVFSGRVVDVAVNENDPSHFYVAYASGGLYKTTNNGITFEPLFDDEMVITTGAVAADWKNNTVWLGTGESNSSRSSYSGVGVYKSADGGKNWQHMGLEESHHIGRIIIHPKDPNTVFVAALGHLYSPNEERGVYKTSNGGRTWEKVLYVNENAGAVDLIFDPKNANTIYAATWEKTRRAWNFVESGEGSAIYKSTDNGKSWKRISTANSGFPADSGAGRIGLTATLKNGKSIIYAAIDNYNRRPAEEKEASEDLTKDDLRDMSKEDFLQLDEKKVANYLRSNRFPRKYSAKKIITMVKKDEIKPLALVE